MRSNLNESTVEVGSPYLYGSDDVPYFPFKLFKLNGKWGITHPFKDKILEINEHSYWILRSCDGYKTWYEITYDLAKSCQLRYTELRKKAEIFIESISDEGLVWWKKRRMEWMPVPGPMAVLWDLTAQCNLRCQHCVVDSDMERDKGLSLSECKGLIDQMHIAGVRQLILSGGEPLLRKDFFEIARYATVKGFSLQVATNATLINGAIAKDIAGLKASAQVSLDALDPVLHDKFRNKKGCWEKTVNGIKLLKEENVPVIIACVVTNLNIHEIPELYKFTSTLGINAFRIMPFVPTGRGNGSRHLEVSPKQMKVLTHALKELEKTYKLELVKMEFECTLSDPPETVENKGTYYRIGCDGAIAYCTITAEGEVLPCNYFYGVETDNVKDKDFASIWRNSRILNYFRNLSTDDINGQCPNCEYLSECRGSCVAANFAHGDIFQPNCHCWLVNTD